MHCMNHTWAQNFIYCLENYPVRNFHYISSIIELVIFIIIIFFPISSTFTKRIELREGRGPQLQVNSGQAKFIILVERMKKNIS